MEERRLDTRLLNSNPYEMAGSTSRMALIARLYRLLLTLVQCGVMLLPLFFTIRSRLKSGSLWTAVFLSLVYVGLYILRLLPFGDDWLDESWSRAQFITGFFEIALLGFLGAFYTSIQAGHASFWWALYIVPVFRLAEVGGGLTAWVSGLIGSSLMLLLMEPVFYGVPGHRPGWLFHFLGQVGLLLLVTFIPYYIVRILDLGPQAARYWFPLAKPFKRETANTPEEPDLLRMAFEKGIDKFIVADWGVLWELDVQEQKPILRTKYIFSRKHNASLPWDEGPLLRTLRHRPGIVLLEERVVPAEPVLQELSEFASEQRFVARSGAPLPEASPWIACQENEIHSWWVAPVWTERSRRPSGFLEVGKGGIKLRGGEWQQVEARAVQVAEAIGMVFERRQQIRTTILKERLASLEQEAQDIANLHQMSIEAMTKYFRRPVLILDYSLDLHKVEIVVGKWPPSKIEWLGAEMRIREMGSHQIGEIVVCSFPENSSPKQVLKEYYFMCPLIARGNRLEVLVLVDNFQHLTATDMQVLRDSATAINAAVARRRAANLLPNELITSLSPSATRQRLELLAAQIKEERSADVVVLYEFEEGRPKLPPIIVGDLEDYEYLAQKPIVIEDPNPILTVARADGPLFYDRVQESEVGSGINRHGDPVFAVREKILSSVGLPLKTGRGIVGVVWINFRSPQEFDTIAQRNYRQLFIELPRQLESLKLIETAQSLARQQARESILADLHDHILQDIIAAGAILATLQVKLHSVQASEVISDISKVRDTLNDAERKARDILDDIQEIAQDADMEAQLNKLVQQLQHEYGFPDELKTDGLYNIPAPIFREMYLIIQEAVRNAAKHGQATRVAVQASIDDQILQVIVKDNGQGFDPIPDRYHGGIRSMQSRAQRLQGKLSIASKEGKGTGIVVEVPIREMEGLAL